MLLSGFKLIFTSHLEVILPVLQNRSDQHHQERTVKGWTTWNLILWPLIVGSCRIESHLATFILDDFIEYPFKLFFQRVASYFLNYQAVGPSWHLAWGWLGWGSSKWPKVSWMMSKLYSEFQFLDSELINPWQIAQCHAALDSCRIRWLTTADSQLIPDGAAAPDRKKGQLSQI